MSGPIDSPPNGSLAAYVQSNLMPDSVPAQAPRNDLPSQVTFTDDIYPSPSAKTQLLNTDPSKISFTTPAEDAKSGTQPDYYLNSEGKLVKNPNAKPSSDGSVKIELEGNNSARQTKQYADKLQKQAIGDLVSAYKAANPGAKIPEMWQSILDAQPDTNYANAGDSQNNNTVTPAEEQAFDAQPSPSQPALPTDSTPTSQPQVPTQPSDAGSGSGTSSSSGGGGDSGSGGGGSSGGGSGSGGGGGSYGGGGGDSSGSGSSSVESAGYSSGTRAGGSDGSAAPNGGGSSYDGASTSVDPQTLLENVKIVAQVAKELGVDPATAVADMLVESGGNNTAAGDNGHSIGLFQLDDAGGEGAGMSVAERQDPRHNAEIALSHFAKAGGDPGQVAYNAERPSDQASYVAKVDGAVPQAKDLLKQAGVA